MKQTTQRRVRGALGMSRYLLFALRLCGLCPLSASNPHISPPTGSRWRHVKRVTAVGLMYSYPQIKNVGDFKLKRSAAGEAAISSSLSWLV